MNFLSRHERLEHLRISESIVPAVTFPLDQLPHLIDVDVPNLRLAKALVAAKGSTVSPDMRPVYGLRIQASLGRTEFATLRDILPGIASTLQSLNISLKETSDTDIPAVLERAPNLVNLEITGHKVIDVLNAARRLRSKLTLQPLNAGPMRDWINVRFPMAYADQLDRWAASFRKAPRLKTLLMRCLAQATNNKASMYDDTQSLSLEDAFRPVVPNVNKVRCQVMQGRDLGLLVTCYRRGAGAVEEGRDAGDA